ncbi:nuclear transport factor 2 family protein [Rhodovulum sp. 12E13]|uniref:nuclear transport factor 2 family protein n=1 Tax=Rhodovulum sp. 12E13 TaxID=2203891 RepID=UPI0013143B22|nr:nuclear transport factor 2 family protein [Rhodovulum sp. 12E13]
MTGAPRLAATGAGDVAAVRAQAVAYCEALHHARADVLEAMCDAGFAMRAPATTGAAEAGQDPLRWDRATFTARVAARDPFPGDPSFEILSVDVTGDIAQVRLWVDVPPRRYEDFLGFVRTGADWRLATKLFRTARGPALEG